MLVKMIVMLRNLVKFDNTGLKTKCTCAAAFDKYFKFFWRLDNSFDRFS